MTNNINAIQLRGESLDSLMQKSHDLSSTSKHFYKAATACSTRGMRGSRRALGGGGMSGGVLESREVGVGWCGSVKGPAESC